MNESTVRFGSEGHLIGTYCIPARRSDGLMAIFSNAGVIGRVGPHRMNVRLARKLAELGIPSLRFDLSGIGDSERPRNALALEKQALADAHAALDDASRRHGARRFIMIGFCSGADLACGMAHVDPRMAGMVLVDPFVYPTWKTRIRRVLLRARAFGILGLAGRVGRRLLAAATAAPAAVTPNPAGVFPKVDSYGRSWAPPLSDFTAFLNGQVARGVRVSIVYTGGAPDMYNYEGQFRDTFGRHGLSAQVDYRYLRNCDHTLTQRHAQNAVTEIVESWILRHFAEPAGTATG